MAPFRIRKEARHWFRDLRDIEKTFKLDFDAYYFCFMAGVVLRQKRSIPYDDTAEIVTSFPERYNQERGKLMVALFLTRELDYLGVRMDEKKSVHAAIAKLVNPESPNHLSDDGMREFNAYAHGGYDVLLDWFDDRPRTLDTFVRIFKQKIDEALIDAS
ncbi:hypothetical protein [Streptomyces chartreusis]|uniref:hypothetical protein n=1 Tax=Streptomyces chartreusis TaxID=1969 RepID=UPI00386B79F1